MTTLTQKTFFFAARLVDGMFYRKCHLSRKLRKDSLSQIYLRTSEGSWASRGVRSQGSRLKGQLGKESQELAMAFLLEEVADLQNRQQSLSWAECCVALGGVEEAALGCQGACVTACMLDATQGPGRAVTPCCVTSSGDGSSIYS